MSNHTLNSITFEEFKEIFPKDRIVSLGDELVVADVTFRSDRKFIFNYPTKFDGYICLYCARGRLDLTIDLQNRKLSRRFFSVSMPGSVVSINPTEDYYGMVHLILVAVSQKTISKGLDLRRIFRGSFNPINNPCIRFTKKEISLAEGYFKLINEIVTYKGQFMSSALSGLATSIIYELANAWLTRLQHMGRKPESAKKRSRSDVLFDDYMKLVAEHHVQQRSVQFYADALCVSTKHLTRTVKMVSGRTASDIIDNYVITEAKRLLRYTDRTIKEVAADLNFCNQTVFYRYFKKNTGMLPSEFKDNIKDVK